MKSRIRCLLMALFCVLGGLFVAKAQIEEGQSQQKKKCEGHVNKLGCTQPPPSTCNTSGFQTVVCSGTLLACFAKDAFEQGTPTDKLPGQSGLPCGMGDVQQCVVAQTIDIKKDGVVIGHKYRCKGAQTNQKADCGTYTEVSAEACKP